MRKLLCLLFLVGAGACSEASNAGGAVKVSRETIVRGLDEIGLNVPGVADNVAYALQNGKQYRERVTDKFSHPTTLTVWVEPQSRNQSLCFSYYRDEKCPDCNGTGQRAMPDFVQGRTMMAFTCRRCEGTGILKNQSHRRCYLLGTNDFIDPAARRETAAAELSPEVNDYARMLADDEPARRLAACEWLDQNFIRVGMFFDDLRPILDRAQYVGRDDDHTTLTQKVIGKRIGDSGQTVYQFVAGRGTGATNRDYYRIYVDNDSGKVAQKVFVGENAKR
ncbi:hypothetical protein FACS1894139_13020 [Planctomycetales bacterium]|nr:hypothetical protein FACS1894107_05780 [Planctomycetales bacterium]GHS99676.1 hypothetical protein FACS1894108_10110 [Planctomycetales bacterium]GHT06654.1 hypothetical protein FACS1894139_13020 [Planctomycetales bacterium]